MEIKLLEVLVMPNNEVLYLGRTIGFLGETGTMPVNEKHLQDKVRAEAMEIEIPFSESDLDDLRNGETFDWTFPVENRPGEYVDVHLRPANDDGE